MLTGQAHRATIAVTEFQGRCPAVTGDVAKGRTGPAAFSTHRWTTWPLGCMGATLQVTSARRNWDGLPDMDMTGERRLPAPRQTVWDALNDPAVLKASIPGCESLEKLSDTQMKATAAIKIGPISARFNGNVQISDIEPARAYSISGDGQGGVAGFAKGGAKVRLEDDGPGTVLSYTVNAQVGGKIAQLGARLIDATAKQMADAFFDRFAKQVEAMAPQPAAAAASTHAQPVHATAQPATAPQTAPRPAPAATAEAHPPSAVSIWALVPREPFGLPLAFWIGTGVFALMMLFALGSML